MSNHWIARGLVGALMVAGLAGTGRAETPGAADLTKQKEFRLDRSLPPRALACIECHRATSPAIFADWAQSPHARANITCLDCHGAESFDPDLSQRHFLQYQRSDQPYGKKEYRIPVAAVVTPKDCSRCHPDESQEYAQSKHAATMEITWKIDPWLRFGLNSEVERASGCYYCHGSVLRIGKDGLDPATWPNVGVGRVNLDGSRGSCTSCHTRHRFSIMEARKPEACGQCHLGPDHPQIEIYMESKHGDLYTAFGDQYNWEAAPGTWTAGVDYRAPTCAGCHMSGSGPVATTHDVTERLSWELQAPLTVHPQDFAPYPAQTNWQDERRKMQRICLQCHGDQWVENHYTKLDRVVQEYGDVYYKPAKAMLDDLYNRSLMDNSRFLDEPLEVQFYELWHHEGRRARMGAAMMAPDYTWWHGFYELKKGLNEFVQQGRERIAMGQKEYRTVDFPNATGSTQPPHEATGGRQ